MQSTALRRGKHVAPPGLSCSRLIKTECPILFSAPPRHFLLRSAAAWRRLALCDYSLLPTLPA